MKLSSLFAAALLMVAFAGCAGSTVPPTDTVVVDDVAGTDTSTGDTATADTTPVPPSVYAGSASYGDLVVFTVDRAAGTCEVINETTGQTVVNNFTVMDGDMAGILKVQVEDDVFFAVELGDKLIAASFPTGRADNTISFGLSSDATKASTEQYLPGDYAYIAISPVVINGSTDIKEWGVLSVIDDGTFRVKSYATAAGTGGGLDPLAPEEYPVGTWPIETFDISGTWAVDADDPVRMNVQVTGAPAAMTGFAYAPDANAVFVLDMGEGFGFLIAMKILPGMTINNLVGQYKFINVWNDDAGEGRSAGRAVINADGTGSFTSLDTTGQPSSGEMSGITACPAMPNMFHATSVETGHGATVTLKHYFVLLPYAYLGFNFRTDDGFKFAGYSVGARLDQ
jgi:hypothetical protein